MARNPFEQLQDVVVEPRQAFEDVAATILRSTVPHSRRVRVHFGDAGVDVFGGTFGEEGEADVYQIKYFTTQWGDSQKRQIRDAYETARDHSAYTLAAWTLCVPVRLTAKDWQWFENWRAKRNDIKLPLDGDELAERLQKVECSAARQLLRSWGVHGISSAEPRLTLFAEVRKEQTRISGLTFSLILHLRNDGDKTAKGLTAVVQHSDTGCLVGCPSTEWYQQSGPNPWRLRYGHGLNHGDCAPIMGIPTCPTTEFPLTLKVSLSAEDAIAQKLSCTVLQEQLAEGRILQFTSEQPDRSIGQVITPAQTRRHPPSSAAGKEILELILAHPVLEERGVSHFLKGAPGQETKSFFINHTKARAKTEMTMDTAHFRHAIGELVQLGWLMRPVGDENVQIYSLAAEYSSESPL
jgi:hypothetical protein